MFCVIGVRARATDDAGMVKADEGGGGVGGKEEGVTVGWRGHALP